MTNKWGTRQAMHNQVMREMSRDLGGTVIKADQEPDRAIKVLAIDIRNQRIKNFHSVFTLPDGTLRVDKEINLIDVYFDYASGVILHRVSTDSESLTYFDGITVQDIVEAL